MSQKSSVLIAVAAVSEHPRSLNGCPGADHGKEGRPGGDGREEPTPAPTADPPSSVPTLGALCILVAHGSFTSPRCCSDGRLPGWARASGPLGSLRCLVLCLGKDRSSGPACFLESGTHGTRAASPCGPEPRPPSKSSSQPFGSALFPPDSHQKHH